MSNPYTSFGARLWASALKAKVTYEASPLISLALIDDVTATGRTCAKYTRVRPVLWKRGSLQRRLCSLPSRGFHILQQFVAEQRRYAQEVHDRTGPAWLRVGGSAREFWQTLGRTWGYADLGGLC